MHSSILEVVFFKNVEYSLLLMLVTYYIYIGGVFFTEYLFKIGLVPIL